MPNPTIDRCCHWLTKNATSKRPLSLVFFDCESNVDKADPNWQHHTFRLATASYCVYAPETGLTEVAWQSFTDPAELWRWIAGIPDNSPETLCVSHNLDYDARISRAFSILPRLGISPTYCILADSCTFFSFDCDGRQIALTDNLSLWPASLAEIGRSVGIEKTHVDFDDVDDAELAAYCRNDVKILVEQWRFWLAFLDEHDLGNFAITMAKQSLNAYRHKFMPTNIGIHNNERAINLERASYKGGRAEAFFLGKLPQGHYYKLDINSLYPHMMSLYQYPAKLVKVVENISLPYLDQLLERYLAIGEVCLEARDPRYVVEKDNKNCYPTGTFFTTLTTQELQIASILCQIRGIGRVALYEPADLFSEFVSTFYSLRDTYRSSGDDARSKMCKLLMNSLQGKFGQVGHKQSLLGDAPIDQVSIRRWLDVETGKTAVDMTFGGKIIRQVHGGEPWDSFPAIPAHVTAYGRMWMYDLMCQAGRENVFYIDTDSLIVNYLGFRALESEIDEHAIGKLKVESESDDVEILARKDYRFGGRRVLKGIRRDAVEIEPNKFSQWHFTTLKWAFARGDLDDVDVHRIEKQMRYLNVAGGQTADGWLEPLHLVLKPNDVLSYLTNESSATSWAWEFDPTFLARVSKLVPGLGTWLREPDPRLASASNHRLLSLLPAPLSNSPTAS